MVDSACLSLTHDSDRHSANKSASYKHSNIDRSSLDHTSDESDDRCKLNRSFASYDQSDNGVAQLRCDVTPCIGSPSSKNDTEERASTKYTDDSTFDRRREGSKLCEETLV